MPNDDSFCIGIYHGICSGYSDGWHNDYVIMRQEQQITSLDPDKMPFLLSPSEAKNMTKTDWCNLGMKLEISG